MPLSPPQARNSDYRPFELNLETSVGGSEIVEFLDYLTT